MSFSCAIPPVPTALPVVMMAMFMFLNSLSSFILHFKLLQVSKILFVYHSFVNTFSDNYFTKTGKIFEADQHELEGQNSFQ